MIVMLIRRLCWWKWPIPNRREIGLGNARQFQCTETKKAALFNSEQSAAHNDGTLIDMALQKIKMIVSAAWVLTILAVAIPADVTWQFQLALAAIGLLPPLALLLWWNDPPQTMSQAIDKARR